MQVTDKLRDKWREQANDAREPAHRCSSCCHFKPAPLLRPGIYTGDDGHCQLLPTIVSYAHMTWCSGWQSDIGRRRERACMPRKDVKDVMRDSGACKLLGQLLRLRNLPTHARKRIEKFLGKGRE